MNIIKRYYAKYCNSSVKIKSAIWYTICNFFQKGISVIVVPIYTRLLTTEQYGSYMIWISWLDIFEIFVTFRLSWGGYTAGLVKFENDRDRYTSTMQCLGFCITSICLGFYFCFAEFVNSLTGMSTFMTVLIFCILYVAPSITFWNARQRVEYRYKALVLTTLISSILIPLIGIFLISYFSQKELALISGRLIVQIILGLFLMYVNCSKNFAFFDKTYWHRGLYFNTSLIPYYLSLVVLQSSNRIIIERLVSKSAAGIFSVAFSAAMVMLLVNNALNSTIQPWLFDSIKKQKLDNIAQVATGSLAFVAVLNLLLTAFAPEAVKLLAPPAYYEAIYVMPPIAASVVIMFCYQYFVNVEFYFEKGSFIAIASIIAAIVNVLLNILLIPKYGYQIAGYVTLICYLLFGVAHYLFMKYILRHNRLNVDIVKISHIVAVFAVYGIISTTLALSYDNFILRYSVILIIIVSLFLGKNRMINLYKSLKK